MKTSPETVDSDLANLMQKLDLRDHRELIKYAVRHNVAAVGQR